MDFKGIARQKTDLSDELVLQDFSKVNPNIFQNIDAVINFAAIVHQPKVNDEGLYEKINHQLPVQLAKLAKSSGVKHFIQLSTIAVYGNRTSINLNSPDNPENDYGTSKLKADIELLQMQDNYFNVTIIRPSMVYGGGKAPGNMLKLINVTKKNIPLPFKNIENLRQFCNIHLLVDALNEIVKHKKAGTFLIADKKGISTFELLQKISIITEKNLWFFEPPAIFLKLLKKFKPSLYDKLYGSLIIDVKHTFDSLNLLETKYSIDDALAEMIKS